MSTNSDYSIGSTVVSQKNQSHQDFQNVTLEKDNKAKSNDIFPRNSVFMVQPTTTKPTAILSLPPGYPDVLYPAKPSWDITHPVPRVMYEAKLTDLISPGYLQVDDVTLFGPLRKDSFFTVSKAKGQLVYQGHRTVSAHLLLPFYKRNPTIVQNGFQVKIKGVSGPKPILTFARKTLYNSQDTDMLEVFLGQKVHPVGQIQKPVLVNEYTIRGESGQPRFLIRKAKPVPESKESKKWKYVIHSVKGMKIVGQMNCKGPKGLLGVLSNESRCSMEFGKNLNIVDKALLLGALLLIAERSESGIERTEEKQREQINKTEVEVKGGENGPLAPVDPTAFLASLFKVDDQ